MTDGTSQGLFIVVAIVIFGIFVVLAYILFEDTLSPAMANMFTTATEQASGRLVYGEDPEPAENFEFNPSTGTITKYLGDSTRVVIPKEINGIQVTKIGDYAFNAVVYGDNRYNIDHKITSVKLPDGLESIGYKAFNTNEIKNLEIPDSVTYIGMEAFQFNPIRVLKLPKYVTFIGAEAFESTKIKHVSIPDTVTMLNNRVFFNSSLETVTMSAGVELAVDVFPSRVVFTYR